MTDNVTENLMNQDRFYEKLTKEEKQLQIIIRKLYKNELDGPAHNTASDIYGGVTDFTVQGQYGHEEDYWFYNNGWRKREPNREAFAEYYGRIMTPEGTKRDQGIESMEEFLPNSKQHSEKILGSMGGR